MSKSAHEVWKYAQKRGLNDKEFKELLIKEGIIIKKPALGGLCKTLNNMSWSINFTGKPEKVVEALDNQAKELTGNSKEEFERALPNLKGLVSLNSNLLNNGLVRIEASGHAYQADDRLISNCIVKIEPVYGILV